MLQKQFLRSLLCHPLNKIELLGQRDILGAKKFEKPYSVRLLARSKALNTKNAFSVAQNRSKKTADKIISNDTNAGNAVSVLAAKSVLTLKSCGHFIVAANKACKSSPNVFPATVKPLLDISNKPNLESLNNGIFHQSISSWIL